MSESEIKLTSRAVIEKAIENAAKQLADGKISPVEYVSLVKHAIEQLATIEQIEADIKKQASFFRPL